ncbi:RagB/SusD family nutrient uptake outer membrane protein [Mucilaginibacter mali]|uniref:RagB/SusD family nutrient uptake outer membrane protein n=1 Tax=Mucilaginibacter mali TaxID=2740462 RepID=UPI00191F707A|nr:RagB/SusD family nutrient uptake outer membrane protein [Mucilaginibacter mali]
MVGAYGVTSAIPLVHYQSLFKIVSEANIAITYAATATLTDAQRDEIVGQALFFRAFAYRTLAYMYGGVPLITVAVDAPRTDLVRATRDAVLAQCITDLTTAAQKLQPINKVADGRISNLAAYHLLSEVDIAAGKFQDAITAASTVISDPNMALMTTRFGSRSTQAGGDVYWDLFREKNQNRGAGNKEAIWVIQFETDVLGGANVSTSRTNGYMLERQCVPGFGISSGGVALMLFPSDAGTNGLSTGTGGRGIGWGPTTKYFTNTIWASDFSNDIRNSNMNFIRQTVINNPASSQYGKILNTEAPPTGYTSPSRQFFPYQSKATTLQHPAALYLNATTGTLSANAGDTYLDQYMFRLAETYLLRAEAYLGSGDLTKAAADINVVRARAKASAVLPANVNIDYILDERMRELGIEEKRRVTLMRLGLIYDRVKKCNPYYAGEMLQTYNLWPIPSAEIERNKDAVLTQNPGY